MHRLLLAFVVPASYVIAAGPTVSNLAIDKLSKSSARFTFNSSVVGSRAGTLGTAMAFTDHPGTIVVTGAGAAHFPTQGVIEVGPNADGATERMYYNGITGDTLNLAKRPYEEGLTSPGAFYISTGTLTSVVVSNNTATVTVTRDPRLNLGMYMFISGGPWPTMTPYKVTSIPDTYHFVLSGVTMAAGTYTNANLAVQHGYNSWGYDHAVGETVKYISNAYRMCWKRSSDSAFTDSLSLTGTFNSDRFPSTFHVGWMSGLNASTTYNYQLLVEEYQGNGITSGCLAPGPNTTVVTGDFNTLSALQQSIDPTPPAAFVDVRMPQNYGRTYTVNGSNCADPSTGLQALIDADAQVQDNKDSVIYIPHGTTCAPASAPYMFRNKKGTGTTVIRTDTPDALLPDIHTRIDRTKHVKAGLLAKIRISGDNFPNAFLTDTKAHGYRLVGLDIGYDPLTMDPYTQGAYTQLVSLLVTSTTAADQPNHILIDRCYIGGSEYNTGNLQNAVRINGGYVGVINSVIHNVNSHNEYGAIAGDDGTGPFLIENNEIQGGSNSLSLLDNGGFLDAYPSDIVIRRNWVYKPLSYYANDPSFATQTQIPITAASSSNGVTTFTVAVPHDIGSDQNVAAYHNSFFTPTNITLSGLTGAFSSANGTWSTQKRVDKLHFTIPFAPPASTTSGGTVQMNALVYGTTNTAVNWTAQSGSITPAGLYTAPNTQGTVFDVITATSPTDGTNPWYSLIVVNPSSQIAVSPSPTQLLANGTLTLTSNQNATWTLSPNVGSLSTTSGTSVVYTAPSSISNTQYVLVTATQGTEKAAAIIILKPQSQAVYRLYPGTTNYTDIFGETWTPDASYVSSSISYQWAASTEANTLDQVLYQWDRYTVGGSFTYTFNNLTNGNYTVHLKFTENYVPRACLGCRTFNIVVNGTTAAPAFDVFAASGAAFKAVDEYYPATVSNGQLTVSMVSVLDNPKADSIEIIKGTEPVRVYAWSTGNVANTSVSGTLSYGRSHNAKNLLELKVGHRVLIDSNIFENNWAYAYSTSFAQGGAAILFTIRGPGVYWGWWRSFADALSVAQVDRQITDVMFRNNIVRHTTAGVNISGWDDISLSVGTRRVALINNTFADVDPKWHEALVQGPTMIQIINGVEDVQLRHNTLIGNVTPLMSMGTQNAGLFATDNIWTWAYNGPSWNVGPSYGVGLGIWPQCGNPCDGKYTLPNWNGSADSQGRSYTWIRNVFFRSNDQAGTRDDGFHGYRSYWAPPYQTNSNDLNQTTFYGDSAGGLAAGKFNNESTWDFHLTQNSPFARKGSDGGDVGVMWNQADYGLAGVVNGSASMQDSLRVRASATANSATLEYEAPDNQSACNATVSTSPTMGTSTGAASHAAVPQKSLRTQSDTITGLAAGTQYYYQITCGSFTTYGTVNTQ